MEAATRFGPLGRVGPRAIATGQVIIASVEVPMFATAFGSFEMIHRVLLRFEDGEFVILVGP